MQKEFDEYMTKILDLKGPRSSAEIASQHASYVLNVAASIYMSQLGETDKALKLWLNAIDVYPKDKMIHNNIACALLKSNKIKEALEHSDKAIELEDERCYFTHAYILSLCGQQEDAIGYYKKVLQLNPNCAMTHCRIGDLLSNKGMHREAFREGRWRFIGLGMMKRFRKRFVGKDWDGEESLENKTVMLFNEQGLGDGIQYSRYIPFLKVLGCRLYVEIQKELMSLYENTGWFSGVFEQETTLPDHDYAISIADLPYFFDPDLTNIPTEPYFKAKTADIKSDKYKVGIVWAGSKWHSNDKNRSCYLKAFKPLTEIEGVQVFSLQKGDMTRTWTEGVSMIREGREDSYNVVNLLEGSEDVKLLEPEINDFNDTASVLMAMDLLISVDTSILHLAGALGKKAWGLIPAYYDGRWNIKWYPSVEILKQPSYGDWDGLIKQVCSRLKADTLHSF